MAKMAFHAIQDAIADLRRFRRNAKLLPSQSQIYFPFCGKQMALTICEDAWNDKQFWHKRLYTEDPVEKLMQAGGNFLLNISASPSGRKTELRREMLASIARRNRVPVAMVNQVGGNDSLVFDGSSMVLDCSGNVVAQAESFEEDLIFFDFDTLLGEIHKNMKGKTRVFMPRWFWELEIMFANAASGRSSSG